MTVRLSTGMRNNNLDAALNAGEQGVFDNGVIDIRSGSQPASANDAPTGTLISQIPLNADAFANAVAGVVSKNGVVQDTSADASGVAGWFRIRKTSDLGTTNTTDKRIDGKAGETADSPDMVFDNKTINAGQQITINSLTITQPAE